MSKKEYMLQAFIKDPQDVKVSDEYVEKYKRFKQQEAVLEGNLLGDFVDGKYVIPTEIKRCLVLRQKVVSEWIENGVRADLLVEGVNYHMELDVQSFDENQDIAYLYLIEKFDNQTLKTYIADYISEKSDLFRDEAMAALHIVIEGDTIDKKEDDELLRRIIELRKKNNADRRFVVEMYSELYVLRMLKLLASCGDIGKKILEEYSEAIKKFGYPGKVVPELYIKLRKILDNCIANNGGIDAIVELNPQVKYAMKELVTSVDYFDKTVAEGPIAAIKKETDKKADKKAEAAAPAKAPAKKPAKGKSKPKADAGKKKADKKEEKVIKGQYVPDKKDASKSPKPVNKSEETRGVKEQIKEQPPKQTEKILEAQDTENLNEELDLALKIKRREQKINMSIDGKGNGEGSGGRNVDDLPPHSNTNSSDSATEEVRYNIDNNADENLEEASKIFKQKEDDGRSM